MLRVVDCGARVLMPQSPEWQRIKNQIDTAMIFAWANFVSAHQAELNDSGGLWRVERAHQNKSRKNRSIVFRTISDTGTA